MKQTGNDYRCIRISAFLLVWLFLAFIYYFTVFSRPTYLVHNARWSLFWSYPLIWNGSYYMLTEVFYNLLMLVPLGFLWPFGRNRDRLQNGVTVRFFFVKKKMDIEGYLALETMLVGFVSTFGIEMLQLTCKKGLFEWDDILHNTIGAMLGFTLYRLVRVVAEKEKISACDVIWAFPFFINCAILYLCKLHMQGVF